MPALPGAATEGRPYMVSSRPMSPAQRSPYITDCGLQKRFDIESEADDA